MRGWATALLVSLTACGGGQAVTTPTPRSTPTPAPTPPPTFCPNGLLCSVGRACCPFGYPWLKDGKCWSQDTGGELCRAEAGVVVPAPTTNPTPTPTPKPTPTPAPTPFPTPPPCVSQSGSGSNVVNTGSAITVNFRVCGNRTAVAQGTWSPNHANDFLGLTCGARSGNDNTASATRQVRVPVAVETTCTATYIVRGSTNSTISWRVFGE